MKNLLLFLSFIFLFSCKEDKDKVDDPVPLKTSGTIKGTIQFYNQYFNLYGDFEQDKSATYKLVGQNFEKEITSDYRFSFSEVPFGVYNLFIKKNGYEIVQFPFDLKYENSQMVLTSEKYISEKRTADNFIELDPIRIRQISTHIPKPLTVVGQLGALFPQGDVVLQADYNANSRPWPIVRFFVNKGVTVSPGNFVFSFTGALNYPYIYIKGMELKSYGFKAGDTISVVSYGDSDLTYYNDPAKAKFPCLSQRSSNVVNHLIQ